MKELSIGWVNIKRMLRERSNIFFVFIFPIALVLLIGVQFGSGFAPGVAIHQAESDVLSDRVVAALQTEESIEVEVMEDPDEVITAVERGTVQAGVMLPEGMDETASAGDPVDIGLIRTQAPTEAEELR